MVAFEAAVAGGIPIIKALREGLTANRIEWIAGIINGTTQLHPVGDARQGRSTSPPCWPRRSACGYAEADPTFDIEGIDAAHKLTIMSAIAFGVPMQFDKAYVEGISQLTREDIRYAEQLGYRIKLLGITRRTKARHRAARASDADSGQAPDRQRRRRDERGAGAGRRRRHDAVLRQGRRRGAHGQRGDRRPGRRHPAAHRRPRAPRAASRVPARRAVRHAVPADGRGRHQLLPAPARAGPARRAGRHHRASSPTATSRSTR